MESSAHPAGPGSPERTLAVSVVVPAYNCAPALERCLAALMAQSYPRDRYEIIVVDDGSTDDTAARAQALAVAWEGRLRVIRKANGGPASARNAGIAATDAGTEVIAFIDADCVAEPDWLACLAEQLASTGADGVGGPLVNIVPPGWISRYLHAARFYRHRVRHGQVEYLVTANVAYRRAALLAVGGFSQRDGVWGEDADLSFRLIQSGYRLLLAQQGIVFHYGTPTSLGGFIRELYRYGYGSGILARGWPRGRQPDIQLARHAGAAVLSPVLALSYAREAGLLQAVSFAPLIAIEHATFCAGLLRASLGGRDREDASHERTLHQCDNGRTQ
jgi:glycosyltransferase involved in cell wall biosynthesis